jgi:subtilisin family serine protease
MNGRKQTFKTRPGVEKVVYLQSDPVPQLRNSTVIGPGTVVMPNVDAEALADSDLAARMFQNTIIDFDLDPITGAAEIVENTDNWGVGNSGLAAARFWDRSIRGDRVRVGIADSGLDASHPAFAGLTAQRRLTGFAHFDNLGQKQVQLRADGTVISDADAAPTFSHWHGTHCAAAIVGGEVAGKLRGMAPHAELAVARVLSTSNTGSVASIAAGLWWLAEQRCDIASLSLGWPGKHEEWATPVAALLEAGTVVVAAVGNEFTLPGPHSRSPANYLTATSGPRSGVLIAVGAHDIEGRVWDDSNGEIVDWSNVTVTTTDGSTTPSVYASARPRTVPTLVGPGVDIVSAVPGGKYSSSNGTSMATPHIAGVIALVLSKLRSSVPSTPPQAAAELVLASLHDLPPSGVDIRSGGGRIDVDRLQAKL